MLTKCIPKWNTKHEVIKMKNEEQFVEEQDTFSEGEDMAADNFIESESKFIPTPKVKDSVEFTLIGVKKQKKKQVKNPKNGKTMDIALSKMDYYYDFISDDDGKAFACTSWQILGKTKAIIKKLGGKYGVKLKFSHIADGREVKDAWKVYAEVEGEYKELDEESNEWK